MRSNSGAELQHMVLVMMLHFPIPLAPPGGGDLGPTGSGAWDMQILNPYDSTFVCVCVCVCKLNRESLPTLTSPPKLTERQIMNKWKLSIL